MHHFDYAELINKKWDNEVINYLSLIHEYKGNKLDIFRKTTCDLINE